MFIQALLCGMIATIASIDWLVGWYGFNYGVVIGVLVGLVLGDPLQGLIYGGFFELLFIGMLSVGGAQPPNKIVGTTLGVAFTMITKQEPGTAIAIVFPAAILMQALLIFTFTILSNNVPRIEKFAAAGDFRAVERNAFGGTIIMGLMHGLVVFVALYFGADFVKTIVTAMPEWLSKGFSIAGGMLPAAGFAVVLNYFLKWNNSYYLIFGFALATYLKLPPLGLAIISVSFGLIELNIRNDMEKSKEMITASQSNNNEGI